MDCLQHRSTKGAAANDGRADTIEHRRYRRVRHVNCHAGRGYSLMRIQDRFSDSLGGAPQRDGGAPANAAANDGNKQELLRDLRLHP